MEAEKSLVRTSDVRLPKFVEQAYDSIEGMKEFANMLLESRLVPDSYYEKGPDNKPDYTKGKTSAVVIVLLQSQQLAVPPMTGLQHIVPVNGLLSIKGDLAKTMIFASGKLKKDSWKETVTGSIEDENMVVSITATREDNGITLTRTFSVDKAKRMGLWITSAMTNGQDGWKYKKSAWFKTPDRMLFYRCLGNLARDLFSDVLLNMYTTEEAQDINVDTTTILETESGAKITIPDKEHTKGRSAKMTDRVVDKIPDNKFGAVSATITEAEIVTENKPVDKAVNPEDESPFKAEKGSTEYFNGVVIKRDESGNILNNEGSDNAGEGDAETPMEEGKYTEKQLEDMDTEELKKMVMDDMDMMEASEIIGGKNTNKKLRTIYLAWQSGKLAEYVAPYMPEKSNQEEVNAGNIPINKGFDKQPIEKQIDNFLNAPIKAKEEKPESEKKGNKYGILIEEETPRDFSSVKVTFNKMMGIEPQITTPRFMELAGKLGYSYPDKETFLKMATKAEIDALLNSN